MKNTSFSIAIFAAMLAGCATPNTGIVPSGNGYYSITNTGAGAWARTSELKVAALVEADAYCKTSKKELQVIHVKETPAAPLVFPAADLVFKCQ